MCALPKPIVFLENIVLFYTGFMEPLEQVKKGQNEKSLHREYSCSSALTAVLLLTFHSPCSTRLHTKAAQTPASSARLYKNIQIGYIKQVYCLVAFGFPVTLGIL